jgi:hypothetical protein
LLITALKHQSHEVVLNPTEKSLKITIATIMGVAPSSAKPSGHAGHQWIANTDALLDALSKEAWLRAVL